MNSKIKRNFILNTAFQVLRLITPLVVTPHISRVLGADGVGIFSYTYSIVYYFTLFAVLGTTTYGAREIARVQDKPEERSHLFWEIWLLAATTSVISVVGWGVFVLINSQYRLYYMILTLYILAAMADISWFFTGLEKFPAVVGKNIAVRLAEVALTLWLVQKPQHLVLYCAIMAGGTFFGNLSLWIGVGKSLVKVNFSKLRPFRHLKGTLIYFVPTIATSVYTMLDKTLIGMITRDTAQNGYYEQATKIVNVAKAITFTSLNMVVGPRSVHLYAQGKFDEVKKMLHTSLNFMLLMAFGISFGIAGIADLFVPWFFGDGFSEVTLLLKVLAPIIIVISVSNTLGYQYYDPAGLRSKSANYIIVGAGCNLCLNLLLIPYLKSAGAIIGSVAAETVITALYLKNCDGFLKLRSVLQMSWKRLIAGAVMFAFLQWRTPAYNSVMLDIAWLVVQAMAVYFAVLFIVRDKFLIDFLKSYYSKIKAKLSKQQ